MKFFKFNRIRIWNPHSARVMEKWIFKKETLVGSDKKCGIKIKDLNGIKARLDFSQLEILNLDTGKVQPLVSGQIFQVDAFVFQWIEVDVSRYFNTTSLISAGSILFFLIAICFWDSKKEILCSPQAIQVSEGIWRKSSPNTSILYERKLSFRQALKEESWLRAKGELDSIREIISQMDAPASCKIDNALHSLEIEFSDKLIQKYIKEQNFSKAAFELKRVSVVVGGDRVGRLLRKLMKVSKELYLSGYRLEDENSEKAHQLMDDAEAVCGVLSLAPHCFMQQTLRQKVPSLEKQSPG